MSLALEMKQFINSEHTGAYVEITLLGELPQPKNKRKEEEGEAEPVRERAKVHYMEAGVGEPLILVHTIGQSLFTWYKVFQSLSEYYRVIAIDLLGHGFSSRPLMYDYTVEEQAETIKSFMDEMGIESAHFIGFSLGSMYTLEFVRRYPERVGRVIAISPGGLTPEMPLLVRMIDSSIFGGIASRIYTMKMVRKVLEECFFDLTNITDSMLREYYRPASDPEGRRAIQYSVHNFDDEGVIRELRTIEKDVLIVQGSEDRWHKMEEINLIHAAIPNSQLLIVRNAGHIVQEEKPDRLIQVVLEHIPVLEM